MKAIWNLNPNLGTLGTIWALTRFTAFQPCNIRTYKSGHHFPGEKAAKKPETNLGTLGTIWALTRFTAFQPCSIRTYKSGHHFQGEKAPKKLEGLLWAI